MGRMLEGLKQERSSEGHQKEAVAEEASSVPEIAPQDESAQQAIPFIEVGTGAAGVDASADVRALMDQAVYPIRLAPILSLHRPHDPAIPKAKPFSRPQSVTFRPFPNALESKRAARQR